jgi:hypothetical protein
MTVFGVLWKDLRLEHIERFLAEAGPEPLLWEAKGITPDKGEIRRQVCGFANSHDGGYLIIGANELGGTWRLDGAVFPNEPRSWISSVIGDGGVTPYPDGLDIKAWSVDDARHVTAVWIPPTPTPPCNTHGTVYERVSGRTISVREPLRLATLFERGDAARRAAERKAHEEAGSILGSGNRVRHYTPDRPQFGLGLAAAGYAHDIGSRLFSTGFERLVIAAIDTLDHGPHVAGGPTLRPTVSQDSRLFESEGRDDRLGWSWVVRITWHGAVGVYWVPGVDRADIRSIVEGPIREAWAVAEQILGGLAPQGPRYLQLALAGDRFPHHAAGVVPTIVGRGPVGASVEESLLASVEREMRRATGEMAYEPDRRD